VELEGCCNGVPATTSGFISKHVSESTQNFESGGSFPRGSAERVYVCIRDDGVLDAGQRDPLTYVRRIYMRFDIALTQLWGGGGCFTMLAFIRVVFKESKSLYGTSPHHMQFFAWTQPRSRVRRHLHVVVSRARGVPVVVRRKT
jgi:hypothetical protein